MDLVRRLAALIEERRTTKPRYLVGVDGPDAAGKTTLGRDLAAVLLPLVVQVSIDDFQRPPAERHARGRLSPEGYYQDNFNFQAFRARLLATTSGVVVADGVFLQRPELRNLWDLVVYLDVSPALSAERGIPRDVLAGRDHDELVEAYQERYLPGQAIYRAECCPADTADVLVDNANLDAPLVVRWVTAALGGGQS